MNVGLKTMCNVRSVCDFRLCSATLLNVAIHLNDLSYWRLSHDETSPSSIQRWPFRTVHCTPKTQSLFRNALYDVLYDRVLYSVFGQRGEEGSLHVAHFWNVLVYSEIPFFYVKSHNDRIRYAINVVCCFILMHHATNHLLLLTFVFNYCNCVTFYIKITRLFFES